jgi:protein-disulfide isomerase
MVTAAGAVLAGAVAQIYQSAALPDRPDRADYRAAHRVNESVIDLFWRFSTFLPVKPLKPKPFELCEPPGPNDHALGPPDALVYVVEYGDFECPNCKQAAPAVKLLLTRYAGRICFIYRHFPVEASHPHAIQAAETAEAANAQGKFWAMHDLLFDRQQHLLRDDLSDYARSIDLNMIAFDRQLDEHVYLPFVRAQLDTGQKSGVRSTPGFFVNSKILDVSYSLNALADAIDKQLKAH